MQHVGNSENSELTNHCVGRHLGVNAINVHKKGLMPKGGYLLVSISVATSSCERVTFTH